MDFTSQYQTLVSKQSTRNLRPPKACGLLGTCPVCPVISAVLYLLHIILQNIYGIGIHYVTWNFWSLSLGDNPEGSSLLPEICALSSAISVLTKQSKQECCCCSLLYQHQQRYIKGSWKMAASGSRNIWVKYAQNKDEPEGKIENIKSR